MSDPRARVVVDRSRCMGSGMCLWAEPKVFDQDDDDALVVLIDEHPPLELLDTVQQAVRTCPGQAIRLELSEGS